MILQNYSGIKFSDYAFYFLLLAFSLNIHTGMTGLVNFGVIFFVAIGAIIVGVLTASSDVFGYDWPIFRL